MTLTAEECELLQTTLDMFEEGKSKCSAWERDFMEDQRKRYEQYGAGIHMSPKQWAAVNRVNEKLS